ncbi:MAG TPA: TonB family protein [Terriglobales bacterium]|jgi:protein TonB
MRVIVWLSIVLTSAALAQAPQMAIPPVSLSGTWASVPLPEMALGITVHDGAIWVCGANEMIAESTDRGGHWSLRHWSLQGGEMLFSLAFQGTRIHAFGTAGTHFVSSDGGATWSSQNFDRTQAIIQAEFSDVSHVFAATARGYATSDDGGRHWHFKNLQHPAWQFVVKDASHAAVVVRDRDDRVLMTTADAGRHWQETKVPEGYQWDDIQSAGTGYRLYGQMVGPHVPPGFYVWDSAAGSNPQRTDVPGWACSALGCRIPGGWAEAATGAQPQRWSLPDDTEFPANNAWAAIGDSFCTVGETLRCRSGRTPWTALPEPRLTAASDATAARCVKCRPPQYPAADRLANRQGMVQVHVVIGTDGRLKNLALLCAPSASLAHAAMDAVRGWIYAPLRVGGVPMEVDSTIAVNFTLRN